MTGRPVSKCREFAALTLILTFTAQILTPQPLAPHLGSLSGMSVAVGFAGASAEPQAPRSNSKVVTLLLAASRAEDPVRAVELLKQAREEVEKEGLAAEDLARIVALIDTLEKKALSRLRPSKPTETTPSTEQTNASAPMESKAAHLRLSGVNLGAASPSSNKSIEAAIAKEPEVQDAMWEIGRSRLARDTENLSTLIENSTGKTVDQLDQQAANDLIDANKPSAFLQLIASTNLMNLDFSKANLKLKQDYSGTSLDVLATELTKNAAKFSALTGTLKGTIGQIGPITRIVGVPSELVMNFLINAKLVLRLADLYGIELDDSEKQIVFFSIYSAFKAAVQLGSNSASANSLMSSFGQKIGEMKAAGRSSGLIAWMKTFSSNPTIAKIAGPAITGALVTPAETEAAKAEDKAAGTRTEPKKRFSAVRAIGQRLNLMSLAATVAYGALAASETIAMGQVAKLVFSSARQQMRAIHDDDFRRFLMTPNGEGFFKLLVLTMNDGKPSEAAAQNQHASSEMKLKNDFIFNLARSGRICSSEDLQILRSNLIGTREAELARYACEANTSISRSERLKAELMTYDSIPQEYVTDLRTTSRERRIRMADLILQMQCLDGDRSPGEALFFKTVISKALGVDSLEDQEYFASLQAFIHDNGGLASSTKTPTGFLIRSAETPAIPFPFTKMQSYTPPNSPEALPLQVMSATAAPAKK